MNNHIRYLCIAAILTAVSAYGLLGRTGHIPPDLRDAVSDGQARENADSGDAKLDEAFAKLKADTGAAGNTPYEILEDIFEKGSAARAEDVAGWHYTLVARSPERAFFGLNGAAQVWEAGGEVELRTAPFLFTSGFDLDTPVSDERLRSLNAVLEKSPVTVKFPPGELAGDFSVSFREYNGYVVVKNAGVKIKKAAPPFDHPVFYACLVKRLE